MKKYRLLLVLLLLFATLFAIKFLFLSPKVTGPDKNLKKGPVKVGIYVVQQSALDNNIFLSGTLKGNEYVSIQAEQAGRITGIYFVEGQKVEKNQLLVKLNDEELRAQQKKNIALTNLAVEKEKRLKKLLDIQAIGQEEYDQTLNELHNLQADGEALTAQIHETEIRAPFSGTMGLREISEGGMVNTATTISTLVQKNPLKLDFSVPEKYLKLLKKGDNISFTVDGFQGEFQGRVYAIDPNLDELTRSIRVRALCANPGETLAPGVFAKVKLSLGSNATALLVPTESLVSDIRGQKVFRIVQGKAEPVVVTTGIRAADKIEISSGLNVGDSIVTGGVLLLKPGSAVVPVRSN
ncbi:MAG: efflux RND transporter periplasmic adaptor subunit [Bacteroidetes bacterium]|nr:efflux RND transporter periplasmic adaptor subunit [Bacteroidota bacterium]